MIVGNNQIFFSQQIKLFKCTRTSKIFKSIKKYGVPVWEMLKLLLVLPFSNSNSINAAYSDKLTSEIKGEKNIYYRLLANQKINWRTILLLFVKKYLQLDPKFTSHSDKHKCLIFDDTDIIKTGKKIEGVSKIFNHVTKTHIFGYKLLVAGYWNGTVFIPVDFSFHREHKNNKKKRYGLTSKEYKNQKKTKREKGIPTVRRFLELNRKKTQVVIEMFKRIVQRNIAIDYILMDSWFTTISLIKKFMQVSEKVDVIGMCRYNSKMQIKDKEYSLKQLRKQKKQIKYSRKTKYYYLSFIGEIDGLEVKTFLIRKGKRGAWHTIISTDKQLIFNKMMGIYAIRWSIEIFFKEAKQLLDLGKSQSTNFDVQVHKRLLQ